MLTLVFRVLLVFSLLNTASKVEAKHADDKQILLFSHDDRVHLFSKHPPWNAVGQIETLGGKVCTATLIAPKVIISSAHCFAGSHHKLDPATVFSLTLEGRHAINLQAAHVIVKSTFLKSLINDGDGWIIPKHSASEDIALVELKQAAPSNNPPVSIFQGSIAELHELLKSHSHLVTQGGYPSDHPNSLWVHDNCRVTRLNSNGVLEHQCDTLAGDSGSPLFIVDHNQWLLIGIQSSAPDASQRTLANNKAVATTNLPAKWRKHLKTALSSP